MPALRSFSEAVVERQAVRPPLANSGISTMNSLREFEEGLDSSNHFCPIVSLPQSGREAIGGEAGIRTLGTLASTSHFECDPFDHSGTSPCPIVCSPLGSSVNAYQVRLYYHKRKLDEQETVHIFLLPQYELLFHSLYV